MLNLFRRHPILMFFILTIIFSWSIYIPLVLQYQRLTDTDLSFSLHYLASFGPMLAAILVTAIVSGKAGLSELWSRIIRWRIPWPYAAFAIFSPIALFIFAAVVVRVLQGAWPDLSLLGQVNYMPYLGWAVLPLWLITFGFGEEIGWRGFVLPRLQRTMSVSKATLVLGLLWVFWHVPSFFYLETLASMSWFILPGFIFGVLCGAVVLTWLYNGSVGSVLMVAIWHALFDLLTASKAGQDIIPILTTAGVIAFALFIANINRPWGFRYQQKQIL